jgi:hypothetical protein
MGPAATATADTTEIRFSGPFFTRLGRLIRQTWKVRQCSDLLPVSARRSQLPYLLLCSSGLLIRGFGVRVPGGAPVLTWCYTRSGSLVKAVSGPCLLVSPDLVPQAALVGLAPARSARPSVPSRPQRPLQSGPTDGITQRDIYRIAQLEDLVPRPRVHARYIGGIREVHRVADTRVPHRPASHGPVASSPTRNTVPPSMRTHPRPDERCKALGRGRAGHLSCRFSARMAQQGTGAGVSRGSQGSGISWLCDAASSGAARLPVSSGMMPSCPRSASRRSGASSASSTRICVRWEPSCGKPGPTGATRCSASSRLSRRGPGGRRTSSVSPIYPAWCEGASGADTVPVPGADLGSIPDLAFAARLHHPRPGLR